MDECSICNEELKEESNITILKCKHKLHSECFAKLIDNKGINYNKCPICRNEVIHLENHSITRISPPRPQFISRDTRRRFRIIDGVLDVSMKGIKSFSEIFQDFTNDELNSIIELNCFCNQITSFEGLRSATLPNLKELYCSNNQIESFEGLSSANLPNLQFLNCSCNKIKSFEGLSSANLPNLQFLNCSDNQIESFEGLSSGSQSLQALSCSNNQIRSFKGLNSENLPNLRELYCSDNPINFWNRFKFFLKFTNINVI
jgi:Leucine-rich repeat (LRR) protein